MNMRNRSHVIEATIQVPEGGGEGVLLSMGCGYAGYALFVVDGVPIYTHNYTQLAEYEVVSRERLVPGKSVVRFEFTKTGENAGTGRLLIDGRLVGEGEIPRTVPHYFGGAEMAVGFNPGYGVSARYRDKGRFAFSGEIDQILLEAEGSPDPNDREALERVALAIQ